MNRSEFWKIIGKVKNSEDKESKLKAEIKKLSLDEVISYQEHFDKVFDDAYQWELWGAAYILAGGCSDDGFIDFRYGLISLGREIFQSAIKDPDSLSALGSELVIDDEDFGYVALEYFEDKTGEFIPRIDREVVSEPVGDDWDFDDEAENRKRLPKLTKLHGETVT